MRERRAWGANVTTISPASLSHSLLCMWLITGGCFTHAHHHFKELLHVYPVLIFCLVNLSIRLVGTI